VRLVREGLAVGRAGATAGATDQRALDISATVRRLAPLVARLLGPRVLVRIIAKGEAPVVGLTETEIDQILLNLSTNARDAMPRGGRLTIETGRRDSFVVLVVTDTGNGMDDATRQRILEPFFTTKASGSGIGLATVHSIVQRIGGELRVSSAPGAGARFEIVFPCANVLARAARPAEPYPA
jgi:signal transduction histidine kinase